MKWSISKKIVLVCIIFAMVFSMFGAANAAGKVTYAGVRSSNYGISPFPSPSGWEKAMNKMGSYFPGSQPVAVWLVGETNPEIDGTTLYFPSDGKTYPKIEFSDTDQHEKYLKYFDSHGIKVFLQVESGKADMETLIKLVLNRYKNHPCVVGFGVDVEWYNNTKDGNDGTKVSDAKAQAWEKAVKKINSNYKLFLKHFDKSYLPPKYRGDIIFVCDSEDNGSYNGFMDTMTDFGKAFYPNTVMYQIGYESDKKWWSKYNDPPKYLGDALAAKTKQSCGIIWVDFTLRDVLPTE